MNNFSSLPLSPATLANLQQLGYTQMTPIQAASLPIALAGSDLIAQAQTGSGKTAAFGLSLLAKINPRWFGCLGNGFTDDTTLFLSAMAYTASNNFVLKIPANSSFIVDDSLVTVNYI